MRSGRRGGVALWAAAAAAVAVAFAPAAGAGQEGDDESPWTLEGEVGTSLYFGASDQTAFLINGGAEHESDDVVFGGEAGFEYGEARVLEGEPYVNKRSWSSKLNLDYAPDDRINPFLSLTAEGSYERRIDLRLSGGLGARYQFVQGGSGRLDLSLSALVERTDPRVESDEDDEIELLARGSARFRARRSMREGGVVFDLVSFYKPALQEPSEDYTVEVTSSLTFALTNSVGLKLSLSDKYDSLAENRGARDNHDGRLFFSLTAASR
ncbi:DUF481 domain-containing protein [Gaopeijia maritima]|uniref:DUF481 domain-containing protein n=1 Tax=Gaopeijia maritima TaxID=3119007 RepID=UPI00324565C1